MSVGKSIKRLREEKNVTQDELAEAVNVSRSMIAQIERDGRVPIITLAAEIADYFGVSIEYFLEK